MCFYISHEEKYNKKSVFIKCFKGDGSATFTNPKLYDKLENKEITMTIRGRSYVARYKLRPEKIVDVVFRFKRRESISIEGSVLRQKLIRMKKETRNLGLVEIVSIEEVTISELTEVDAEKCGYSSLLRLKRALRRFFRFISKFDDDYVVVKISFRWIGKNRSIKRLIEKI